MHGAHCRDARVPRAQDVQERWLSRSLRGYEQYLALTPSATNTR